MDQLRFTGLHEDGAHLVLTTAEGADYSVPIDDRLRAALRTTAADQAARSVPATPREVQTRIRAGASAEEICEDTGWSVERVRRFEGPILAERAHVSGQAQVAVVRSHERSAPPPTLEPRVRERLAARGVDTEQVTWDATRPDGGRWSVRVRFMAGQRIRHATWSFDPATRSVEAVDDEARWLSEDEQSLPAGGASSALFGSGMDGPDDLMSSIRERSRRRGQGGRSGTAKGQRGPGGTRRKNAVTEADPGLGEDGVAEDDMEQSSAAEAEGTVDPSAVPGKSNIPPQALPLEDLPYDPDTMGLPPAAGRPADGVEEEATLLDEEANEPEQAAAHDDLPLELDDADEDAQEDDPDDLGENEDGEAFEETREATLADFFGDDEDDEDDAEPLEPEADEASEAPALPAQSAPVDRSAKADRQRKGRPSVPSWDDIMFGARDR